MRQINIFFILLLTPFVLNSQTLKGKIYDATGTVKNIKVLNETQNRVTATNEKGDFTIIAKVNDTLLFESLFYHPKAVVVNQSHFKDIAVFELVKIVNELDEVEVKAEPEQPVFTEVGYNLELQNLIKEDIKNHPEKYKPAQESYGVDFVYLIGELVNLFKRKTPKYKKETYSPITYMQLDSLFDKNAFFNKDLVTKNFKIPEDKVHLFYDFCAARQMSSELLKPENKMEFLEHLVSNSQLFLILLEQYGENSLQKD